uniref:CSON001059 protein n=1 Tax=Culicoides sonorensis TaxID=179676 RepID=A0A336LQH8_CULSO
MKKINHKKSALAKSFHEFCQKTSIAGYINIIGDKNTLLIEKFVWILINLGVLILSITILVKSWYKFDENPFVTSLDNMSYDVTSLYFPAIAVCNINQMSRQRTFQYAEFLANKMHDGNANSTDINWFFDRLKIMGQLLVYSSDATKEMIDFQMILDELDPFPDSDFWDVDKAMRFMSPQCEDHIFKVKFNGIHYKTSEVFQLNKADEGFCCTFNYLRPSDTVYNDTLSPENKTFPIQIGMENGFEFFVFHNESDYYYPTMNTIGSQILIFNPFEYPEALTGNYRRDILEKADMAYFDVTPKVRRANYEIRRYSRKQVKVKFL